MRLRLAPVLAAGLLLAACADESARPFLGPVATTPGPLSPPATLGSQTPTPPPPPPSTTVEVLTGLVPLEGFDHSVLRVVNGGENTLWPVLYADDIDSRRRGLMGVTDLAGYAGMVFVFAADTEAAFWMRNTPMPLSIVFLRADGSVGSIRDMEPCADVATCPTYAPGGAYRFALEVPQGQLPAMGIDETSFLGVN